MTGGARTALIGRLFLALGLTLLAEMALASAAVGQARPNQLLIYYANETTAEAAGSETYRILLDALARSPSPAAVELAEAIRQDIWAFPAAVRKQVADLIAAAQRRRFDLAIFTNELAHRSEYLFVNGAKGEIERARLPDLPRAESPILEASPLAHGAALSAALASVGRRYPAGSLDTVLIVNSHGDSDLAIIPRIFADLSRYDPADVLAAFEGRPLADGSRLQPAMAEGVSKLEFWRSLQDGAQGADMRLALVFRQACESGVSSWRELRSVPASLGAIAHTARGRIAYEDVVYAELFSGEGKLTSLAGHLTGRLRISGIHVDDAGDIWKRLLSEWAAAAWPYFAFLPLLLWLGWYAWSHRVLRAHRAAGD